MQLLYFVTTVGTGHAEIGLVQFIILQFEKKIVLLPKLFLRVMLG